MRTKRKINGTFEPPKEEKRKRVARLIETIKPEGVRMQLLIVWFHFPHLKLMGTRKERQTHF